MELLQIKNEGKIVICNAGNFYIAIGKGAVLLSTYIHINENIRKSVICKSNFRKKK